MDYSTPNKWAVLKTSTSNIVCTEQDVFKYLVTYICNYTLCAYITIYILYVYITYIIMCAHIYITTIKEKKPWLWRKAGKVQGRSLQTGKERGNDIITLYSQNLFYKRKQAFMKHVLGKDFKAGCRFEGWGMSKVFQISGLSRAMAFK